MHEMPYDKFHKSSPYYLTNRNEIDTLIEWVVHGFVLLVGLIDLVITIVSRLEIVQVITYCLDIEANDPLSGTQVSRSQWAILRT